MKDKQIIILLVTILAVIAIVAVLLYIAPLLFGVWVINNA